MEIKEAIEILKTHNEWRRGADVLMEDPKVIGEAIDCVVAYSANAVKPITKNEWINQFEQSLESFMQELPDNVIEANRGAFDTMKTLIRMQKQEPDGRVKEGEVYYYLTTNVEGTKMEIHEAYDFRHDLDNKRYDTGNYFKDRADAYIRQSIIENFFQEKKCE